MRNLCFGSNVGRDSEDKVRIESTINRT